jgi:hypothetical protein
VRATTHTTSAAPHTPASRTGATRSDSASLHPPSYGIGFADRAQERVRAQERISEPGEAGEREAHGLAQRFLTAHRGIGAAETPAAFGRFTGHDLARVRIDRGERADAQARALGADAFTLGDHIAVARGDASADVLAHELAHVVAQRAQPALASTLWRTPPKSGAQRSKQAQTAGKPKKKPVPPPTPPPKPAATKPAAPAKPASTQAAPKTAPAKPPAPASATPKDPVPFAHPFILAGLPADVINRDVTDRYPELRLNGSEWYGAWSLGWSLLNPLMQPPVVQGGDATPGKWAQDYTRFGKYATALQRLTPGKGDPYLDVASLLTGTRVEDWISHDRVLSEGLKQYWWQAGLGLLLAQGVYSGIAHHQNQDPGAVGSLQTDPTYRHFQMLTGLAGIGAKSKFLTLGGNPLSFTPPLANEAALPSSGPLSSGIPGSGLSLDFQKGVGGGQGGHRYTFGMPFNLGRQIRPDKAGEPKSPLELGLWGSYDEVSPTATQLAAGTSEPSKTYSFGALGGYDWLGGLDYRYRQSGGLEMHQGSLGLGYLSRDPKDALEAGRVSFPRFGVAGSYASWSGANDSVFGPRLGADGGEAGRFSPYLDLNVDLGSKYQLSFGAQGSVGMRSAEGFQAWLDGLRFSAALQNGTSDADRKRIELAYSLNRYEWLDPSSPLMHGLMLKGQWGPWFGGAQVNWMQGGLEVLQGGPYERDFAASEDPLRDVSLLFNVGYRFEPFKYLWGAGRDGFYKDKSKR